MANERNYICKIDGCERRGYARGLCSAHYQRERTYGDPLGGKGAVRGMPLREKIKAYVHVDASGCWIWQGGLDSGGYGQITVDRTNRRAHRVSYEVFVGPVPDGLQLDHRCRVHPCVNPAHLEPVTPRENTERGWLARGLPTYCGNGHLWAENARPRRRGDGWVRECRACSANRTRRRRSRRVRDTPE